jgi:hypoxanthine-DNA glycosylase
MPPCLTPDLASPILLGLPPVLAPHTRLLVLGSFPGGASLAAQQYYGHPRNQFWPIVGALLQVDLMAMPYEERIATVRERGLGVWDAYASCRRVGSLDSAIEAAQFNDFSAVRRAAPHIVLVVHNGAESARALPQIQALGWPALRLPSTSPANASWSFERKLAAWRQAFEQVGLSRR